MHFLHKIWIESDIRINDKNTNKLSVIHVFGLFGLHEASAYNIYGRVIVEKSLMIDLIHEKNDRVTLLKTSNSLIKTISKC